MLARQSFRPFGGAAAKAYDYLLVLDFEATCTGQDTPPPVPQEIIEFPCLKVNARTFETEAVFHQYVRPDVHVHLTPFCTKLTGIIQDMVDGQPTLEKTLRLFDQWLQREKLFRTDNDSCVFVTCGDWDLKTALPKQCGHLKVDRPWYFSSWINVKKAYCRQMGSWPKSLMTMLDGLGLEHAGRLHSGIDDCRNIASVLKALGQRGHVFSKKDLS